MLAAGHHSYTWHEYLILERDSSTKHEFFDGEIYARAGGTATHAKLAARILGKLGPQLDGKPCQPYTSDLRVRVAATGLATSRPIPLSAWFAETFRGIPKTPRRP